MRIGMMLDAYKPYISGVTNVVDLTKKSLEEFGHEVFVFTFGDNGYEDGEANVIRSPGLPVNSSEGFYFSFRYPRTTQKLLHTMDIVHVHHPFISGRLALRYTRGRGIPVVFTNHTRYDLYAKAYLPIIPDEISETAIKAYLPSFCRSVDLVIAPSYGLHQVLLKFGVDANIVVVPNGVDMSRIQAPYEPLSRRDLGIEDEDVLLIFVGRIAPEKNIPFLVRAFAGVAESFPDVKLLLVGDGPEFDNIKDLVSHMNLLDRVFLTGRVPYEDVPRYLHLGDVFVTASVTEVHPLTVIEAMGAGLPVLGIASPGVGDTVEDGVTGFLAQREDLSAFTTKMVLMVGDKARRQRMSAASLLASNQYDFRRTTRLLEEQYVSLINTRKPERSSVRARMLRVLDRWTG